MFIKSKEEIEVYCIFPFNQVYLIFAIGSVTILNYFMKTQQYKKLIRIAGVDFFELEKSGFKVKGFKICWI